MKELANLLAMQHLVNAYSQETSKGHLLERFQQTTAQLMFSQGLTLLSLPLQSLSAEILVPLSYVSLVGRHRLATLPQIFIQGVIQNWSSIAIVSFLLDELVQDAKSTLDSASLIERWIQSREALAHFLTLREDDFDALVKAEQDFLETEQALLLGHSMHPAPKSRSGFVLDDLENFSPEAKANIQLHYCLIAPEFIVEGSALDVSISTQFKQQLTWCLDDTALDLLMRYPHFKVLPLHPWQARYLQTQNWYKKLKKMHQLIELGENAWSFSPTTSVRTLASFSAPWQLKPSLSVMITNSIRVNLEKECYRGEMTYRLWHSQLGQDILSQCPSLRAVNDPAWIAVSIDGKILNETICIFRDQPFKQKQQITCIASLCQDHPDQHSNRFNALFARIAELESSSDLKKIALDWFNQFLAISLKPLMYLYHHYGMAFESHQQNVLLELEDSMPKYLWLRDNQGFYYIQERATEVLAQFPDLQHKAEAVGTQAFVDERFSYYFFANTLFGLINAIGSTGYVSERELLDQLQHSLLHLFEQYPNSSLLHGLLHKPTIAYKANLLTRLHELDELIATVEQQSVYVQLVNPLYIQQKELAYA